MRHLSKLILIVSSFFIFETGFTTPSRVLIIRHAEKPDFNSDNLSPRGYQRAQALADLFNLQPRLLTFGKPVRLFAFRYLPGQDSNRAIETATPLAKTLGLAIDNSYGPLDAQQLAQHILDTVSFNQKMVMIVWKHSEIQKLAQALGASTAPAWNSAVFDRIWQIDYNTQGQVSNFKDLPQMLLPGDSQ